jgi:hypothetical protein
MIGEVFHRYGKYFFIFIVLMILGISLLFLYSSREDTSQITESSREDRQRLRDTESIKKSLLSRAVLIFPEISNLQKITYFDLPQAVKNLISQNTTSLSIMQASFDKRQGYLIDFESDSLEDSYNDFRNIAGSLGWQQIFGTRSNYFAFLEYENPDYLLRFEETRDIKKINIEIKILRK